ncbi:MAG TPA: response regulator [Thermoanaerobaculia bacterium]|nr:response regulator [Thermoanaerobaculia bacterium]
MSLAARILVLEDHPEWLSVVLDALARQGFLVDGAASAEAAANLLAQRSYDLLVLDISLDPNDAQDTGGLEFLERLQAEGKAAALSVIVLSGNATLDKMHDVFVKYRAVDFVEKKNFDNDDFAELVARILSTRVKVDRNLINRDLAIVWQGVDSARNACLNLRIDGSRRKAADPLLDRAGAELEDLLSRLFSAAETVLAQPMARGKSGSGVLKVQPFYPGTGAGRIAVVKFGEAGAIRREEQNFRRHVRRFLGGGRSTGIEDAEQRSLLGAIHYSLLGTADDEFVDFADFYGSHGIDEVCGALDNLFLKTCAPWYANAGGLKLRDLGEEYRSLLGLSAEGLEEPMRKGLKSVQGKDRLHFDSLTSRRAFLSPLPYLAARHFACPTYECITHGDLNAENIFVDRAGSTWLIDFLNTGPGHILRDFAVLDVTLRVILLPAGDATLDERLALEEDLLARKRLGEFDAQSGRLSTSNQALAKTHAAVVHLRRLAADQVRRNPGNDIGEYSIALLFYALRLIRFWDLPMVQREHAMLSAALLAERLGG